MPKTELDELDQRFIFCRMFRSHAWDETHPWDLKPKEWSNAYEVVLRCTRCTTVRRDVFSSITHDLASRDYVYPKGYRVAKSNGIVPIGRDYRREMMTRIKAYDSRDEMIASLFKRGGRR